MAEIYQALNSDPIDVATLRRMAISEGGLLTDEIRCKVWPKLLSVNTDDLPPPPGTDPPGFRCGDQGLCDLCVLEEGSPRSQCALSDPPVSPLRCYTPPKLVCDGDSGCRVNTIASCTVLHINARFGNTQLPKLLLGRNTSDVPPPGTGEAVCSMKHMVFGWSRNRKSPSC